MPVASLLLVSCALEYVSGAGMPRLTSWYGRAAMIVLAVGITYGTMRVRGMLDAVREAAEKYRLVVSCASEPIVIRGADARLEANFRTCEMMGCAEQQSDPCIACSALRPWRELLFAGDERSELTLQKRDGAELLVEVSHRRLMDGRAVAILRDITARRRAEDQMRALLAEKELLLKEVHHRVKNNLQIICSLLSLQAETVMPAARGGFQEARERVSSIALAHETLYQSPDMARVDFGRYVARITSYLGSCYEAQGKVIRIHTSSGIASLDLDHAIPCGLIINELVSNALKHAFHGRQEGEIFVGIEEAGEERLRVVVRDTGLGLPPGFRIGDSDSLGLQLVSALTGQLRGEVAIRSAGGAQFEITFGCRV